MRPSAGPDLRPWSRSARASARRFGEIGHESWNRRAPAPARPRTSNYLADDFQQEVAFFGISSPSFVLEPEGIGVAERFIRTGRRTAELRHHRGAPPGPGVQANVQRAVDAGEIPLGSPAQLDVTSSGWTRQRRMRIPSNDCQEPWGATGLASLQSVLSTTNHSAPHRLTRAPRGRRNHRHRRPGRTSRESDMPVARSLRSLGLPQCRPMSFRRAPHRRGPGVRPPPARPP